MLIQYLGTGASEGMPGVFCRCDICAHARKEGGKNIRRRSCMVIDKVLLIDMPPDIYSQALAFKVDLAAIQHCLFTHAHFDHLYPAELRNLLSPYSVSERGEPLKLYGSEEVRKSMAAALGEATVTRLRGMIEFTALREFEQTQIGPYIITPLKARHCPGALIYMIESDGRVMLYGNDTGFFPEETWDFLAGKVIHLLSLDCNNPLNSDTPNHMTIEDCITVKRRLFQQHSSNNRTRYVATHFSHLGGLSHAQLDEKMRLHGITAAYDGLELRV
ncbi:MAG: MBL fold metallo-hydrolase [Oscillospiraceae bacterium]|nr:MBL fold metallo-hydrolase [Oscillospiraceae bacterium]